MRQKRATTPWNTGNSVTVRRGRPRKDAPETNGRSGCVWPEREDGTACQGEVQHGLALCPQHGKILMREPGSECAWPGCPQGAPFRSLCLYHDVRAHGLLDAAR